MPMFSQEEQQSDRIGEDEEEKHEGQQFQSKEGLGKVGQQQQSASMKDKKAESEEYNILSNILNKALSNLEVKVTNASIRVLTQEINFSSTEIPTYLLRIPLIDYKSDEQQQNVVGQQQKGKSERKQVESDLEIILSGKKLEVPEISLHYLPAFTLHPEQMHYLNPYLSSLQFPYQYPLLNDPCTLLILRPIYFASNIRADMKEHQQANNILEFKFQNLQLHQKNDQQEEKQQYLVLNFLLPNLEIMLDFSQLKGIFEFSNRIIDYDKRLKFKKNMIQMKLDRSDLSNDSNMITIMNSTMNSNLSSQFSMQSKESKIDLYGTIIRTNSINVNDLEKYREQIEKRRRQTEKLLQKENLKKKKPSNNNKGVDFIKNKLIKSFLKAEIKQKTKELSQSEVFRQGLGREGAGIRQKIGMVEDLQNSMMISQDLYNSFTQTRDDIESTNQKNQIGLYVKLNLQKVSISLIQYEKHNNQQKSYQQQQQFYNQNYDRIFDSIYYQITEQQQQQQQSQLEGEKSSVQNCLNFPLERREHRIGQSYYNLEMRNVQYRFTQQKQMITEVVKSKNPFAPKEEKSKEIVAMKMGIQIDKAQLISYDLSVVIVPSQQQDNNSPNINQQQNSQQNAYQMMMNDLNETTYNYFYNDLDQSSEVFKSINEFQSIVSQKNNQQQQLIYEPKLFSKYIIGQLYIRNYQQQHFCQRKVLYFSENKIKEEHLSFKIQQQKMYDEERIEEQFICKGNVKAINIRLDNNDILCIWQLLKHFQIDVPLKEQELNYNWYRDCSHKKEVSGKLKKKITKNESVDIQIQGIELQIQNYVSNNDGGALIDNLLRNYQLQEILIRECNYCDGKVKKIQFYTIVQINLPIKLLLDKQTFSIQIKRVDLNIKIDKLNAEKQKQEIFMNLIQIDNLLIRISKKKQMGDNQSIFKKVKEKYRVERAKIIYEDKEIESNESSSQQSADDDLIEEIEEQKEEDVQERRREVNSQIKGDSQKNQSQQKQQFKKNQNSLKQQHSETDIVKLFAKSLKININVSRIENIMEYLINLESYVKLQLSISDIVLCYRYQDYQKSQKQSLIQSNNKLSNKQQQNNSKSQNKKSEASASPQALSPSQEIIESEFISNDYNYSNPFLLQVQLNNGEVLIYKQEEEERDLQQQKNQCKELLKLRIKCLFFQLHLQKEFLLEFNKQTQIYHFKEQQLFIKIELKIDDGFLLDYTLPVIQFHPYYFKNQDQTEQASSSSKEKEKEVLFEDELWFSAPWVLFYKQQGLEEKYKEPRLLHFIDDITIKQLFDFKSQINLKSINNIFKRADYKNKVLQLFQDLDTIKKNLMKSEINLTLQGLITKLTFDSQLLEHLNKIKEKVAPVIKKMRVSPIDNFLPQERDITNLKLNLQDMVIDYIPSLKRKECSKYFSELSQYKFSASRDNRENESYFIPMRCLLYLSDSQLILKEVQNTVRKEEEEKKETQLKQQEVEEKEEDQIFITQEKSFIAKTISLNLLDNTKCQKFQDTPLLLIDCSHSLDSISGQSILDQQGFAQIFVLDHIELQLQKDLLIQKEQNPILKASKLNQSIMNLSKLAADKEQQAYEFFNLNINNNYINQQYIFEQENIEDENDMYETAYEGGKNSQAQFKVIQERIFVNANKILIFLAKDSFQTSQKVIKCIIAAVMSNKKKSKKFKKKVSANKNTAVTQNKKQQEKQELEEVKLEELEEEEESAQMSFQEYPSIIEDALILQLEKLKQQQDQQMNFEQYQEEGGDDDEDDQEMIFSVNESNQQKLDKNEISQIINQNSSYFDGGRDDYMLEINEGGIHKSLVKEFNLDKVLIEDHFPEFNENDFNETNHRKCHNYKIEAQNEQLKSQIIVEVITLDLRLYDGLDFDFDQSLESTTHSSMILSKQLEVSYQMNQKSQQKKLIDQDQQQQYLLQQLEQLKHNKQKQKKQNQQLIKIEENYLGGEEMVKERDEDEFSLLREELTDNNFMREQQQYSQIEENKKIEKVLTNSGFSKKIQQSLKRKRKSTKAGSNYFSLLIKNPLFSRRILTFAEDKYNSVADKINERTRICFSVKELQLKETLSKGGIAKQLIHLPEKYKYDNQIWILLVMDEFDNTIDVEAKIQLQTFKLLLNQDIIAFIQRFFDLNLRKLQKKQTVFQEQELLLMQQRQSSSLLEEKQQLRNSQNSISNSGLISMSNLQSQDQKEQKVIYIKSLKIFPFRAILSYSSKSLNLKVLTEGNIVEFLNVFNIHDLKIQIKQYELKSRMEAQEVAKLLLAYYSKDIIKNQKANLIKAIGPMRSMANIAGAVYGIVKLPYQSYQQEKSILQGFGQGMLGFYTVMSNETIALSNKVIETFVGEDEKQQIKKNSQ